MIKTPDGTGEILSVNVLMQNVKAAVKKSENDPPTINFYAVDEIKVLKQKKNKPKNTEGEKKPKNSKGKEEMLDMDLD